MAGPPRCPKCGGDAVAETVCPRLGWNRHGGRLNPRTCPTPCHRTDAHRHYYCRGFRLDSFGLPAFAGCGHRWTR